MRKVKRGSNARKLNRDAGFSLLELLIAVVILAIIVIPLLNLFLSSNRINIKSRQTLRATTAAQDIMEGLKAYDIEEVREQFKDPASGFYVIDSRLIKGGVREDTPGAGNPSDGLYVFSMKELNLQGSKFDAKITVDGRGYMDPDLFPCAGSSPTASHTYDPAFFSGEKCTVCGAYQNAAFKHDGTFNDAALADARSIDKNNGTFVETTKIRRAVLDSVFKDTNMKAAIKNSLKASGVADADLEEAYKDLWKQGTPLSPNYVCYKNARAFFDQVSREIYVFLTPSSEVDENGDNKVDMKVTQVYIFEYGSVKVRTTGDVDTVRVGDPGEPVDPDKAMPFGSIAKTTDGKVNVNLFYYPLYGASAPDKIIINNNSGLDLNLLIAKQRYEKLKDDPTNPGQKIPDLADPEYLTDPELMTKEQSYRPVVEILDTDFDADAFSIKTNLGLNLVGEKYLAGAGVSAEIPDQLQINGTGYNMSELNIFTLDGVRSPLGKAGASGEITELIYDVEVSVYREGAAANGFPNDERMVVIEGSMTN